MISRDEFDVGGGYRLVGRQCRKCRKFEARGIDKIYPPKCPRCGR